MASNTVLAGLGVIGVLFLIVLGFGFVIGTAALYGWIIMLIAGSSGHAWMGFGTAWLWGFVPAIVFGAFHRNAVSKN